MDSETEYDPESGVEVEICRACEELTDNLRNHAARLRQLEDLRGRQGIPGYEDLRKDLISDRDSALDELTWHQRQHSDEFNESQT